MEKAFGIEPGLMVRRMPVRSGGNAVGRQAAWAGRTWTDSPARRADGAARRENVAARAEVIAVKRRVDPWPRTRPGGARASAEACTGP
ncbi:hypothetical protein ACFSL4_16080 [Streptomyces caeni]|uniref:Transposase n=1 Tax=Streptomyces caeni TaxID=2307231 RepID=A0ABW4IRS4_9ACTN